MHYSLCHVFCRRELTTRVHSLEDSVTSIYLDQQLTVMAGSNEQWVGRVGDTGGGQYQVNIPHILGCWSMLEMGARTSSPSPCWPGNGDRRMLWATFASLK